MADERYIPFKPDMERLADRIEAGAAQLDQDGHNAQEDGDLGRAEEKANAATAARDYAEGLRTEIGRHEGGAFDPDRFAQAEMVARASELGGILIDGREMADRTLNDPDRTFHWDGGAERDSFNRGEHCTQEKAATIEQTGVFGRVSGTIDQPDGQGGTRPVEQVPFFRLGATGEVDAQTDYDQHEARKVPPVEPDEEPPVPAPTVDEVRDQVEQGMGMGADGQDVLDGTDAPMSVKKAVAEEFGGPGAGEKYEQHAEDPDAVKAGADRWEQTVKDNTQPKADDEPEPKPTWTDPADQAKQLRADAEAAKVRAGEQQAQVNDLQELVDENNKLLDDEQLDNEERSGIETEIAALENEQYLLEEDADRELATATQLEAEADRIEYTASGREEQDLATADAGTAEQAEAAETDADADWAEGYGERLAAAAQEQGERHGEAADAAPDPRPGHQAVEDAFVEGFDSQAADDTEATRDDSYWATRAQEHRDSAAAAREQAEAETDEDQAQEWRNTATDADNLATACERNSDLYDLGLDNDIADPYDHRGDAEKTAQVEEDAAERASVNEDAEILDSWEGDTTTYRQAGEPWVEEAATERTSVDEETDETYGVYPGNNDTWSDEDEMRASGHPAAQAADFSQEPLEDVEEGSEDWDARTADEAGPDPTAAFASAEVSGAGWGDDTFFPVVIPPVAGDVAFYHPTGADRDREAARQDEYDA